MEMIRQQDDRTVTTRSLEDEIDTMATVIGLWTKHVYVAIGTYVEAEHNELARNTNERTNECAFTAKIKFELNRDWNTKTKQEIGNHDRTWLEMYCSKSCQSVDEIN